MSFIIKLQTWYLSSLTPIRNVHNKYPFSCPPSPLSTCVSKFDHISAPSPLSTCVSKFDHISAYMRDVLHWLPLRQRIQFRVSVLVWYSLIGQAPAYLIDLCRPSL